MSTEKAGYRFPEKFLTVMLFTGILPVAAAQQRAVLSLSAQVPVIQVLEIAERTPFPAIRSDHMAQGFVQVERAVVLIVRSNAPWRLTIRSSRGNLYMTPGRFKPVEHFQWRVAGGTFHAVEHAPAQVARGEGGAGTVRVEVDYRMILNWTDTPPGDWMFEPDYFVEPDEGGFLP